MDWSTIATLATIIAAVLAIVPYLWPRESISTIQQTLQQSSNHRHKTRQMLMDRSFGQNYLHFLRISLVGAWKVFGRRTGSKALALSIWFAFFYGWLLFWALWSYGSISEVIVIGVSLEVEDSHRRLTIGLLEVLLATTCACCHISINPSCTGLGVSLYPAPCVST